MAKTKQNDDIFMKPLPSTRAPWLAILLLLAAIVLLYIGFLRPPGQLFGPPLQPNEWYEYMREKPKPAPRVVPAPAQPATPVQPE